MADSTPEAVRLTADVALFGQDDGHTYLLLVRRHWDPYKGHWALPGGHVDSGETAAVAAHRELAEETGIRVGRLEHVGVYSAPGRDPRGRYVTTLYTLLLGHLPQPTAGDDAADARWFLVDEALSTGFQLAFDHRDLIGDALRVAL